MKKRKKKKNKQENMNGLIEKTLEFVEKDRVGIFGAFAVILGFAFIRSILECSVFEYASVSLYLRANHIALYFGLFMTGTLLITLASGIPGRKVFNVVLFGWIIIITPPIIDFFLGYGGFGKGYPYSMSPNILINMRNDLDINHISKIGYGEFFQLYSIVVLSSLYVFLRKKSAFRAFLTGLFLFVFIAFIDSSAALLSNFYTNSSGTDIVFFTVFHFPIYPKYYPGMGVDTISFLLLQQLFLLLSLYYTLMFLVSSYLFVYVSSKERARYFFKSIKWIRISSVIALVYLGVFVSGVIYPEYIIHEVYIGFAAVASVSGAQFWNMMEELNSDKEWKAPYMKKQYRNIAIVFALLSIFSSYLLGNGPFTMLLLFLFTAYVYTSKPFEGIKTSLSPFIFSLYGIFPFLIGFYTPSYWLIKIWGPHIRVYDPSMLATVKIPVEHPLTQMALVLLTAVYAISFFIILLNKKRE